MAIKSSDPMMLPAHVGIGSNDPSAGRSRPNPGGPRFANDHQLPTPEPTPANFDAAGLPILTDEEVKWLKDNGTEIVFAGKRPDGTSRRF